MGVRVYDHERVVIGEYPSATRWHMTDEGQVHISDTEGSVAAFPQGAVSRVEKYAAPHTGPHGDILDLLSTLFDSGDNFVVEITKPGKNGGPDRSFNWEF